MPRLPHTLLRRAHGISPHLRTLLPACRDIESARHELRWIREHVRSSPPSESSRSHGAQQPLTSYISPGRDAEEQKVARLCARRGRGEPLQYVLGTQPFGALEIRCTSGVLIPRPETEAWAVYLADVLARHYRGVDNAGSDHHPVVLDLCTGTGCIALLLHERLRRLGLPRVRAAGLDVSPLAVTLARHNRDANARAGRLSLPRPDGIVFQQADVFAPDALARRRGVPPGRAGVDVLVSNPPYISGDGFARGTGRSVRNYEPALALVPGGEAMRAAAAELGCALEDVFYARLFDVARELRPDFVLFEVGDLEQARRVVKMAARMGSGHEFGCEIWRDEPDAEGFEEVYDMGPELGLATIRGEGHGRSVFVYRKSKA
ncbi:Altered inheritance of mitochondria protein 32 [Pestalotiopsis sp. IQ-011]